MTGRVVALVLAALASGCGEAPAASDAGSPAAVSAPTQASPPQLQSIPHPEADAFKPEITAAIAPARAAFERAVTTVSGAALGAAHGKLGLVYQAHQQQQAAAACFTNAMRLAPDDYRWPYHLAVLREETGDFDLAVTRYQDALTLAPDYLPAATRLGLLHLKLGRTTVAENTLNNVIAADRNNAAALAGLGDIARDRDDPDVAAQRYRQALELDPMASQLNYRLGLVNRELGDLDAARAALAKRGERIPRIRDPLLAVMQAHVHPPAHYIAQADAAIGKNDLRMSAQLLALALAVEPTHEQALVTLGEVLLAARRDDAARQQFQKLVEAHPGNALGPYYLGLCALRAGDRVTATQFMRDALRLDPGLERAKTALARLGDG